MNDPQPIRNTDPPAGLAGRRSADAPPRRFRFPKRRRVASGDDFTAIIGNGSFAADETLIVNALPTSSLRRRKSNSAESPPDGEGAADEPGRLGVTIPRKTGNAVVRNRWKRLIREAYRLLQHELPAGFDFVVRPRRGALPEFARVHRSLRRLAARAAAARPGPPRRPAASSAKRRAAKRG